MMRLTQKVSFFCVYKDCTGLMVGIEEDSVRYAHSGPSQRFLRGLRPLVSVGPLPLPVGTGMPLNSHRRYQKAHHIEVNHERGCMFEHILVPTLPE